MPKTLTTLALASILLFTPFNAFAQAVRNVGPGETYATLEALSQDNVLQSGDTIQLNFNIVDPLDVDNSLTSPFTTPNLTLTGTGRIEPADAAPLIRFYDNNDVAGALTLDSTYLAFTGFIDSVISIYNTNILGGTNVFSGNTADWRGGVIYAENDVTLSGGKNVFTGNEAGGYGGAILSYNNVTLSGGTNVFTGNSSRTGGAIFGESDVTLSGGKNTFSVNSADSGGAIVAESDVTLSGGKNTFSGNSAGDTGGAINGYNAVTLSGGKNEFTGNEAGGFGGAIVSWAVTLSSGKNTFSGNSAGYDGGAIYGSYDVTLSGGTNVFTGNEATGIFGIGGAIYGDNDVALSDGTNVFTGNVANNVGGAIYGSNVTLSGGTNVFTGNEAGTNGGAIYGYYDVTLSGGKNTFSGNTADWFGGGAVYGNAVTLSGGKNTFSDNSADSRGGAIYGDNVAFSGGKNTFSDNSTDSGGAIYGSRAVTLSGGTNVFTGNEATGIFGVGGAIYGWAVTLSGRNNTFSGNSANSSGGAIYGANPVTLSGGTNVFTGNEAGTNGGAIYGSNVTLSGGTNVFTGNEAGTNGGAIYGYYDVTLSGGTNVFTGNEAGTNGGAIYGHYGVTLTAGTNVFTGNKAGERGGAIYVDETGVFRATDGDVTFRGNRDGVDADGNGGKANAIYANNYANRQTLTLAAEDRQNIYFYDPITSNSATNNRNLTIRINPEETDTGRVIFDGSDYTEVADRHSAVYGNTTVGNGMLGLKGDAIYGAAENFGTFTLERNATLATDYTTNRIQANSITMNGLVDVANGGTLELAAASGTYINGTVSLGLGFDPFESVGTFGAISVFGHLTLGNAANVSLYWNDTFLPTDTWSQDYVMSDLFAATGTMDGFDGLSFDASSFANSMFVASWNDNYSVLTLSYSGNNEIPEPATLAIVGLGLAGLGWARRWRRK